MSVKQYGSSDNQCGLALDVAHFLNDKFEGLKINVHDTGGVGIYFDKANKQEVLDFIKSHTDYFEENQMWWSGPTLKKNFDILIVDHYDLYGNLNIAS